MPDITMCSGEGCPKKEQCYRFTARPDQRQSYFAKPPINDRGECSYFLPDPVDDSHEVVISDLLDRSVVPTLEEAKRMVEKAIMKKKR